MHEMSLMLDRSMQMEMTDPMSASISSSIFLRKCSSDPPHSKKLKRKKNSCCSPLAYLDSCLAHRWRDRIRGRLQSPGRRRTCGSDSVPLSSSRSSVHGSHLYLMLKTVRCSLRFLSLWLLVDAAECQRL